MGTNATNWVESRLKSDHADLKIWGRTPENFITVSLDNRDPFNVAVSDQKKEVQELDISPFFSGDTKPQLVVNVPSGALWHGDAIDRIHRESAAFGTVGDIARAAKTENPGAFRDKKLNYLITALQQHGNTSHFSYIYDLKYQIDRKRGAPLNVAVTDAYNMGAEDVRNAKSRLGDFDIIVKTTSYGSITGAASMAAESMGARALKFRELMSSLWK